MTDTEGIDEFKSDIEKAIEKHLPQAMYEKVKEEIKKVDYYRECIEEREVALRHRKEEIDKLSAEIKTKDDKIFDLQETINNLYKKYGDLNKLQDDLDDRDKKLQKGVLELENKLLIKEAKCEKDKSKFAMDLLNTLVRNTTYKKKIMEDIVTHHPGKNDCGYSSPGNVIHDGVKTTEEEEKEE